MNNEQNSDNQQTQQLNIAGVMRPFFTTEDLENCWTHLKEYLVDILNGEYDLEDARVDIDGLRGSEWDKRISNGV